MKELIGSIPVKMPLNMSEEETKAERLKDGDQPLIGQDKKGAQVEKALCSGCGTCVAVGSSTCVFDDV